MEFAYTQADLGSHRGSILRHGPPVLWGGKIIDGVLPLPSQLRTGAAWDMVRGKVWGAHCENGEKEGGPEMPGWSSRKRKMAKDKERKSTRRQAWRGDGCNKSQRETKGKALSKGKSSQPAQE